MLETVDLSLSLDRKTYVEQLTRRQIQLRELGYQVYVQKRPVVILYEGWDAAGKGGSIKRLTEKLDPRGYVVYPISAPAGEDKTHHYLYRFWRRLPERGGRTGRRIDDQQGPESHDSVPDAARKNRAD